MTLKERILNLYTAGTLKQNLNDTQKADRLFDIVLEFIIKNKWTYYPLGSGYDAEPILNDTQHVNLALNCFELSKIFIALCEEVGIKKGDTFVYQQKPTIKIGQELYENNSKSKYRFECFDPKFVIIGNQLCFNQHCVAQVNSKFYDLVFSSAYEERDTPYDNTSYGKVISHLCSKNESEALRVLQTSNDIDLEQTFSYDSLLVIAASNNFPTIISFLLDKGINANVALTHVKDMNSESFILLAKHTDPVIVEDIKKNRAIVQFSIAVGIITKGGSSEEFAAAMKGLDINFKGLDDWTWLHYAASWGNQSVAEFLLVNGANANLVNCLSKVPLHYATDSGLVTLISKYTDPVIADKYQHIRATRIFHEAVEIINNSDTIEELSEILKVLDVNFKDSSGWTLLHYAAGKNNLDAADFLLSQGADANIKNSDAVVPLHYAGNQNSSMFKLLSSKTDQSILENEFFITKPTSASLSPAKDTNIPATMDISMQVLGGFIAVMGCAAVAAAFILLNAATLGTAGLVVAGLGVASSLVGIGLFAMDKDKKQQSIINEVSGNMESLAM